jgi:hypothetical protein
VSYQPPERDVLDSLEEYQEGYAKAYKNIPVLCHIIELQREMLHLLSVEVLANTGGEQRFPKYPYSLQDIRDYSVEFSRKTTKLLKEYDAYKPLEKKSEQ